MTLSQLLDLFSKIGLGGLLVAILYGSYKRIWVWGSEIRKVEAERDEWKEIAMSGTHAADVLSDYAVQQQSAHEAAAIRATRRQSLAEEANHPPPRRPGRGMPR